MTLRKRRSGRHTHGAANVAAHAPLVIEPLEPICLLTAAPTQADYEAWQAMTFQGADAAGVGFSIDTQQLTGAGNVSAASDAAARQQIGSDQVRQTYGYTGAGYTIAILDTGIDYTHPALQANYAGGWDFVDNDNDPRDLNGHGTHVAGIIASTNATYLGIAPNVKVISLRVLDANGTGSFGNVERALQWVAQHQAQFNIVAVNMSLGAGNYATLPFNYLEDEFSALKNQGVFIAAASGNSFYTGNSAQGLGYPAISNNTVAVGAVWSGNYGSINWASGARDYTTAVDRVTSFTQRSSGLDILAPGAMITSTYLNGQFVSMAGTSMATPVIAAASVIIRQALDAAGKTALANQDSILQIMQQSGVTVIDGDDENDNVVNSNMSFKRLNLLGAIQAVVSSPSSPATSPNTGDRAFIASLYKDVLGRAADTTGLNAWAQQLQGGMSRATVASAFWNSTEHRSMQVQSFYSDFLGRSASSAEVTAWVKALQSGVREIDVMRTFISSPEYNGRFATNTAFVQSLYSKVLGRTADSGGLTFWNQVLSGGAARAQVTDAFFGSTEYFGREVDDAFHTWLQRSADAGSRQAWVNALRNGTTIAGMNIIVLGSDEYRTLAINTMGSSATGGGAASGALAAGLDEQELSEGLDGVALGLAGASDRAGAVADDEGEPIGKPIAPQTLVDPAFFAALAAASEMHSQLTDELDRIVEDLSGSGEVEAALRDAIDDCYQSAEQLELEIGLLLSAKHG